MVEILYALVVIKYTVYLKTAFLSCTLPFLEGDSLVLFPGGGESLEKCTAFQEGFRSFSVVISSWDRSEGESP